MDYQLVALNSKINTLNKLMITKMMYDNGMMSKERYKQAIVTLYSVIYNINPKDFDDFYNNFEKRQGGKSWEC